MCFNPIETYKVTPSRYSERKYYYHASGKHKLIFPFNKFYPYVKSHPCAEMVVLPCGKCEKCLCLRAKNWSIRAMHEARYYEHNSFITLTYRDSELPFNYIDGAITHRGGLNSYDNPATLNKRDFQLFMKRLRKMLDIKGIKIKYLMCGEYGDLRSRPHYHAIIFGYQFEDLEEVPNNPGSKDKLYDSKTLEDLWTHGKVKVGEVTTQSIAYTCRYTMKKMYGDDGIKEYQDTNRIPPYLAVSHGVGKRFYEEFHAQIIQNDYVLHPEKFTKCQLPRYYDKLTQKRYGDDFLQKIKQKRLDNFSKQYNPNEDTPARRAEKMEVYLSKIKVLRRIYETNPHPS